MSSPRATLIALGAAAALGAAYWGWTYKLKPARARAAEEAKKPFAGLKAEATQELLLRKGQGSEVLLRKVEGAWRLLKPIQAPADAEAVATLVQALADAGREETIVEKDAELRQYGLDAPSGAVSFVPASPGAKPKVLFFGNDNPLGSSTYAMVDGEPQVFLLASFVKTSVLKDAADLRDKAPWRFDGADVQGLRSTHGGGFSLERGPDGAWKLRLAGKEEPARAGAVESWLGELGTLKALRVPSEDGKGGAWGLNRGPRLAVTLKDGRRLQLNAGSAAGSEGFHAQGAPGSAVFVLPASALLVLEKPGKDLADRQAFALNASEVERFEVIRPQGKLTAVRADGAWSWQPKAEEDGKEFDFEGFIGRFAGTELLQRLPKTDKPAKPTATVFFYGASGAVLEGTEFGAQRGAGVVAYSANKRTVTVVAGNLLDGLPPALSATAK